MTALVLLACWPHFAMAADAGTQAPKADAEVEALVDRVQAFYEKTKDFTAEFKQDYTYKLFKRTQTSTGKVLYKRGDKPWMRWDYEKPAAKSFVLADDKVRLYDPEAKSLTITAMSTDKLSASVTFLWGQGKLAKEFSIAKKECSTCAGVLLELTPKTPDPRFKLVKLEVDPKTAQVLKSTVTDPDGSENAITFLKLVTNAGVEDKAFVIKLASGTQTFDMTAPPPAPAPAPKDGG